MGEGGQSPWTGEASGHLLVESACGQSSSVIWLGLFMFCRSRTFSVLQSGFFGGQIPNFGEFKKCLSLQSDFSRLVLMESQLPALQVKFVSTHLTWVVADVRKFTYHMLGLPQRHSKGKRRKLFCNYSLS